MTKYLAECRLFDTSVDNTGLDTHVLSVETDGVSLADALINLIRQFRTGPVQLCDVLMVYEVAGVVWPAPSTDQPLAPPVENQGDRYLIQCTGSQFNNGKYWSCQNTWHSSCSMARSFSTIDAANGFISYKGLGLGTRVVSHVLAKAQSASVRD